jgi:hypothetical protein
MQCLLKGYCSYIYVTMYQDFRLLFPIHDLKQGTKFLSVVVFANTILVISHQITCDEYTRIHCGFLLYQYRCL